MRDSFLFVFAAIIPMAAESRFHIFTLILSPLRAGRGELERTCLGSLFGDSDTLPPKVPLSLRKRERGRVRVRLDCMDTAETSPATRPSGQRAARTAWLN